jgi:hypothetical protein
VSSCRAADEARVPGSATPDNPSPAPPPRRCRLRSGCLAPPNRSKQITRPLHLALVMPETCEVVCGFFLVGITGSLSAPVRLRGSPASDFCSEDRSRLVQRQKGLIVRLRAAGANRRASATCSSTQRGSCSSIKTLGPDHYPRSRLFSLELTNKLPRLRLEGAHSPPCLVPKLATCIVRGMGHGLRC